MTTGCVVSCLLAAVAAEESPLVLFTAMAGKPDAAMAHDIVERSVAAGFSQWVLYPSTGLEYDYMGEEWLSCAGEFLKAARAKGGHVWLYDEFNWPSGSCHGRVPRENPAWTYSELAVRQAPDGTFAWEVKRNDQYSMYERYFDVNTYEPAAMRRFIELTHEVYAARFGEYLKDGTVRGIFTDEPGHPSRMKWTDPQPVVTFRFWSDLETQYRERTGRAFRADVERALAHPDDPTANAVFETYTELKGRQFERSYFKPIFDWCRANGIESCGHMIGEGDPMMSTACNGLPLELVKKLTLPGMDKIGAAMKRDDEWLTYSHAQYGIEHNSAPGDRLTAHGGIELFALGPCDLTLSQLSQRIWVAALYGMDTYYIACWYASARRFAETSGYAMFADPSQPWFDHCADLHAEAKEAARQSRKRFVRKVGVRYPQRLYGSLAVRNVPWPAHPHLIPLVCEFAWNQVSFELLQEDEPSGLDYVFDCKIGGTFVEEKSGRTFDSPAAVRAWLEAEDKDAWRVVDDQGKTVAGVLTRRYADGTGVVLNLTERDYPTLTLMRGRLPSRRIALPPRARSREVEPPAVSEPLAPDWKMSFDRAALRRIWFDTNGIARLTLDKPVPDARWIVCNLPEDGVCVTVDGRPVVATQSATSVPPAYAGVYRASESFTLAAGTHELHLDGRVDDSVFLPSLWLETPADAASLASFAGRISYSAEVDVPRRAGLKIRLEADGLVADVLLDGASLGERGIGPFEWEIPESKKGGRHALEIRLYSSVRPIFGPESAPGVRLRSALWCPTSWNAANRGLVRAEWKWTDFALAAPFADGMVLQRGRKVPVWGVAPSGARVTVSFADQTAEAAADAAGLWRVDLNPIEASKEPRTLTATLRTSQGPWTLSVSDVLVGEVWLVAGQSNMMYPLCSTDPGFHERQGAMVAQITHRPTVRFAKCWSPSSVEPRKLLPPLDWRRFEPENLMEHWAVSAVAYYFAMDLSNALDVPIGLLCTYQGATCVETWTPACGFALRPELKDMAEWRHVRSPSDWPASMNRCPFNEWCQQPSMHWNARVEPLVPFAVRGMIWYQGCHNANEPQRYCSKMHALYDGWSKRFENPGMPFYFVQLPAWGRKDTMFIQEAQAQFAAEEPHAGMVVANDVGNVHDIHPNFKEPVGRRLALQALAKDYGFADVECESPSVKRWRVVGNRFVVDFAHAKYLYVYNFDRSLSVPFEIAGADGVFRPALIVNADRYGKVGGATLEIAADDVVAPRHLRYLHCPPWTSPIYNQVDLPLGPFHLDEKDGETPVGADAPKGLVCRRYRPGTVMKGE